MILELAHHLAGDHINAAQLDDFLVWLDEELDEEVARKVARKDNIYPARWSGG